jgi:hypothetical protein
MDNFLVMPLLHSMREIRLLTLHCRSVDGLANGRTLVTKGRVIMLCESLYQIEVLDFNKLNPQPLTDVTTVAEGAVQHSSHCDIGTAQLTLCDIGTAQLTLCDIGTAQLTLCDIDTF